jgi:hypothetical protein
MAFTGLYGGYTERDAQNRAQETQGLAQLQAAQGIMAKMQAMKEQESIKSVLAQSGGDITKVTQGLMQLGTPSAIEALKAIHPFVKDPHEAAYKAAQTGHLNAQTLAEGIKAQQGLSQLQGQQEYTGMLDPRKYYTPEAAAAGKPLPLVARTEADALAKFGYIQNPDGTVSLRPGLKSEIRRIKLL